MYEAVPPKPHAADGASSAPAGGPLGQGEEARTPKARTRRRTRNANGEPIAREPEVLKPKAKAKKPKARDNAQAVEPAPERAKRPNGGRGRDYDDYDDDREDERDEPSRLRGANGEDEGEPEPAVYEVRFPEESMDQDAVKVLLRLSQHGYQAYLVGGGVRDLLLGRTPKDFDVATSARPQDVRRIFRNCRVIGRRFRLAHVLFHGGKIIEVATFRRDHGQRIDRVPADLAKRWPMVSDYEPMRLVPSASAEGIRPDEDLLIVNDNVFGEPFEDAIRRDFTINGLFYDIEHEEVIDYVGGMADVLLEIEQARSAVVNAAAAIDGDRTDRERALSAAKVTIGRVGTLVAEECVQLHGGIGITWELPFAHHAKRLVMIDHQLGDEDHHLERYIALGRARAA